MPWQQRDPILSEGICVMHIPFGRGGGQRLVAGCGLPAHALLGKRGGVGRWFDQRPFGGH